MPFACGFDHFDGKLLLWFQAWTNIHHSQGENSKVSSIYFEFNYVVLNLWELVRLAIQLTIHLLGVTVFQYFDWVYSNIQKYIYLIMCIIRWSLTVKINQAWITWSVSPHLWTSIVKTYKLYKSAIKTTVFIRIEAPAAMTKFWGDASFQNN